MQLCKYGNEHLKLKQEPSREASPTEHKRWKQESQVLKTQQKKWILQAKKILNPKIISAQNIQEN